MPTTGDINQINMWIDELLTTENRGIAKKIAEIVLSMNKDYPRFNFKSYITGNNKISDIRFCFDRGNDCTGERIMTSFFILKSPMQLLFNIYNELPADLNKILEGKSIGDTNNWYRLNNDYCNFNSDKLKKIIYYSFEQKAQHLKAL